MVKNNEYYVTIAGPRPKDNKRDDSKNGEFYNFFDALLMPLYEQYRENFTIITIGCDCGIGHALKSYCQERQYKLVEFVAFFTGPKQSKDGYNSVFLARHEAIKQLSHEYHLVVDPCSRSQISDLLDDVRQLRMPYTVYHPVDFGVIETNMVQPAA